MLKAALLVAVTAGAASGFIFQSSPSKIQQKLSVSRRSSADEEEESGHLLGYGNSSHVPSTLQKIASRRLELALEKEVTSDDEYERLDVFSRLKREEMVVAAEFKRSSPSKGPIATSADIREVASEYASAGAGLISVLTEPEWFGGSLEDMKAARLAVEGVEDRPAILRKDFVLHEGQLREAKAFGADTALLIVACLTKSRLKELVEYSMSIGIEPLVEAHTEKEMELALWSGARCIGINNRNLHSFELDMDTTRRLSTLVPPERRDEIVLASLSGLSSAADVADLGVEIDCVLVGEAFMRAPDKGAAIREISSGGSSAAHKKGAKVCGLTSVEDAMHAARAGADLLGLIFAPGSKRAVDGIETAGHISDSIRAFGERTKRWQPPPGSSSLADRTRKLFESTRRGRPVVVGVVQDQPLDEVLEIREKVDLIQLHGDESLEFAQAVGPHIRVVHVPAGAESTDVDALYENYHSRVQLPDCHAVLLDAQTGSQRGGTGQRLDAAAARAFSHRLESPVILAGGIDADVVHTLVDDDDSFCAFDASSKLEQDVGVKDQDKLSAFVAAVKAL